MPLSKNDLMEAYRRMRTIRTFEEHVKIEFERGNVPGFVHFYVGQEACAVGVCMNLKDSDSIGSTHRGHGHCIAKGCDVKAMMSEIYGRRTGLCGGKGGSMHIADFARGMLGANAIVGGNPPLVIGAALSAKTLGNGAVGVSFTGDGGANQGTTFESMNMAVVLRLPAIFVFENNGYGEFTSHDYAVGSKDIAARAAAFGMPAVKVDGTDFFLVYEAARAMIERARAGEGPGVIEVIAKRWHPHYLGDPETYRSLSERQALSQNDPLVKFRVRSVQGGQLQAQELERIDEEAMQLVAAAISEAAAAPFPPESDLLTDVYSSYP